MPDSMPPAVINRVGFDIYIAGKPELYRSLDKHCPRQNDFAKTIISSALQLENSFGLPRSIVVGGLLDPGQISQISGFFSDETAVLAYVLTKNQLAKFLQSHSELPAVFVFSSHEKPFALDAFRMLASSLSRHSEKYGTKLLNHAYEEGKKLERLDLRQSHHSLVLEEKFGKIIVLRPDESTIKDRIKFFSRGGLDWDKSRDDQVYFENGWASGSFYLRGKADPRVRNSSRIHLESIQILDSGHAPTILGLKSAVDCIHDWIEVLRREKQVPELNLIQYSIPSVPVVGWIGERFDRLYGKKLRHSAPSLLWGWHPGADFVEFIGTDSGGASLLIDMEDFPKVTATLRYGAAHEH